ncbi:membrane protein [Legionella norrlandica]|uniref:Membrane protein n=1 Tax=Legionella norrlandica TaxID=1498499 RepID=A0A0A2STA3_9GAMM|nr:MAPEG family protein [Legionella norrlandica]KGP63977.1 membrane protein [Legionella norrlandica]
MFTIIVCLFIAVLLPYLAKIPVAYAMHKAGGYDNHYPREQQARLEGFGARALAAHQNSFESLLIFATAALTALATNTVSLVKQYLAMGYIIFRLFYHLLYLLDWSSLRSIVWFASLLCCLSILWLSIP